MFQSLLADFDDPSAHTTAHHQPTETVSSREPVKILVVGLREGVLRLFLLCTVAVLLMPTSGAACYRPECN